MPVPSATSRSAAGGLRVRLYAGTDPVTGRQTHLREIIQGTDEAAWRKVENKLTEFRAQAFKQRTVASAVPSAQAVDEWMQNSEVTDSTRDGYVNYDERYIRPALGSVAVRKIDAQTLERFYADLRRCRTRRDKKPFVEHRTEEQHDCEKRSVPSTSATRWRNRPCARSTRSSAVSSQPSNAGAGLTRTQRASPAAQVPNQSTRTRQRPPKRRNSRKKRSAWMTTGNPRVARDDYGRSPRRVVRSAFLPRRLRRGRDLAPHELGQR